MIEVAISMVILGLVMTGLVLSLSQQVFVLDFGAVIASGTPDEIRGSQAVQAAYLGMAPEGPAKAS